MSSDEDAHKLIDNANAKVEPIEDDIKKRRPKPFRYLTNDQEIESALFEEKTAANTIMTRPEKIKVVDDQLAIMGLGDVETIENVIRKHEASRKIK
jgi:hypothetical protein